MTESAREKTYFPWDPGSQSYLPRGTCCVYDGHGDGGGGGEGGGDGQRIGRHIAALTAKKHEQPSEYSTGQWQSRIRGRHPATFYETT
jgi:hypothetical protein